MNTNTRTGTPVTGKRQFSDSERTRLSPFFWDVAMENIDIDKSKRFVIERLLRFGRPGEVLWILKRFSSEEIIDVIKKSRTLDARTVSYWAAHFSINKKEIACLNPLLTNRSFY